VSLFPERRTRRADRDKFPGITPERVLEAAIGLLHGDLRVREPRPVPVPDR
jgi:hypothetical protein